MRAKTAHTVRKPAATLKSLRFRALFGGTASLAQRAAACGIHRAVFLHHVKAKDELRIACIIMSNEARLRILRRSVLTPVWITRAGWAHRSLPGIGKRGEVRPRRPNRGTPP